ncbi:TRAP transporter, 4TM/12TM fusion protein [Nitratireductor indicus C115]|uniref:TRAP transporter, 4TM/12TM fusion protein n=1 Tax=Nitratireductor indicus C115 TaxID=1231190 RepID=K2PQB2_9HYPH|nr:TRAP transporter fused permease subunit [Nitratireductor indicus]EKF43232.1 TRAP transporter, 4TM/12TM fusion protein [Nitratireductor indicus C115]SFQ53913.1 TRAP transporter, 4TM/12TM fusion protein [Nitratireductor indicus]
MVTSKLDTMRESKPFDLSKLAMVVGLLLVAFQIYTAGFGPFPPLVQRSGHTGLALIMVYLTLDKLGGPFSDFLSTRTGAMVRLVLAVVVGGTCFYIVTQDTRLVESFAVFATPFEIACALVLMILVAFVAYSSTGVALPLLAVATLLYTLFGNHIAGRWGHSGFDLQYTVEYLYLGTEGIWGQVTGLSAGLIAIFIIFGAVLLSTGAAQSFMDIALLVAGRRPGGAAKVATASSAFMGMLNGSAVANVATTGNFSIPAMKRLGYRPRFAAAVEATASSGGQITPPIMGAGAFIMAELLGVPYTMIAYAAIIPAVLFFACVWFSIDIEARREGMKPFPVEEMPHWKEVFALRRFLPLALTLVVTLGAMFTGRTPSLAAFYGIVTNVTLFLLLGEYSWSSFKSRFCSLLEGVNSAASGIVSILALLVCAQITLSLIGLTGVGVKLTETIMMINENNFQLLAVVFAMIVALVLGMGMPTTAAYLLSAAVAAPALIRLGIDPISAHFFVFYSALLSALTPPVCTAVFTAAVIAREHWWPICIDAMRLATMKYLLPFFFIYREGVLLKGTWYEIASSAVMGLVAAMLLAIATGRFYRQPVHWYVSAILALAGVSVVANHVVTDLIALLALATVVVRQWLAVSSGAAGQAVAERR